MKHGIIDRLLGLFTVALCGVTLLLGATSAQAQGLEKRVSAAEAAITALLSENDSQQAQIDALTTSLAAETLRATTAEVALAAALAAETSRATLAEAALAADLGTEAIARTNGDAATLTAAQAYADSLISGLGLGALSARLGALEQKTQFLYVVGTDTIFSGTNLLIQNGAGASHILNGLGNLIVGYNEASGTYGDERIGSHNIVVGRLHDYISSSGLVAGYKNRLAGVEAFIAGTQNVVVSPQSSILGGHSNRAAARYSTIGGGIENTASGFFSSVNGGRSNIASGSSASVNGGLFNIASGNSASVNGGESGWADGMRSSVNGGRENIAAASFTSVMGGRNNSAIFDFSVISAGVGRSTGYTYHWVAGVTNGGP